MIRPAVRPLTLLLLASSALIPAAAQAQAQALPTGGSVARGSATIGTPAGGAMTVTQSSDRAIINWQSFSIGDGNRVDIRQPDARSVLLNRVTGETTSTIAGSLNANGQVFLINPNGIQITSTGTVRAAGFVASTLDIGDDDFMRGDIVVTGRGGRVANAGTIAIVRGGYAALIGGEVDNSGLIHAPLGRVALGAGTRATLDLAGDGFLQVALPAADAGGIAMSGRISADGGSVILSAASAVDAARHIVNLTGVIEARGVGGTDGAVTLTGGDIRLASAAIDVSGAGGGGSVRIGGDRQGRGALAHARTVKIDAATRIRADAIGSGDGGDVTIWSDEATRFAGAISARGAREGSGGQAEVSSAGLLDYRGAADLTGAAFGTLLLDPYNITISSGADSNPDGFTPTGADSVINVATLTNALALANVTVSTGAAGSAGAQAGDITLAASLDWTSSATLTLQAAGDIALNGAIDAAAGGLTLDAGGAITDSATLSVARFRLAAGDWSQVGAALPAFAAGDFSIATDGGATFLRATGGTGAAAAPYLLTDIYGVQGINGFLTGSFALGADIDAAGTAYWNGGAGFVPLGTDGESNRLNGNTGFTGQFDGQGHVISGLTINRPSAYFVGMFGWQGGGTITRIGLVGGTITGKNNVGGLLGYQIGGSISQAYATGIISGNNSIGGLVGKQTDGSIDQSYATGSVTGVDQVGGLVGWKDYGSLSGSYAAGNVSGHADVGGLVGYHANGDISQSYATGSVNGTNQVGGLVGYQVIGSIRESYATGSVTGTNQVGGLVGWAQGGDISGSYWDSYTTGQAAGFGLQGATVTNVSAVTSDPAQSGAANYAFNKGAYANFTFAAGPVTSAGADGWVWAGSGTRPFLAWEVPTAPAGGGPAVIRNAHQLQLINAGDLNGNYVLANDIDLTADLAAVGGKYPGMWSEAGFVPLGADGNGNLLNGGNGFTGNFDGQGHVIAGLLVNRPRAYYVGLFGYQSGGSINRVGLVDGSVSGYIAVGGLVGAQVGGSVAQNYTTGSVNGVTYVGGLVGYQRGDSGIAQSHATGSVSGDGNVGGLVGYQDDGGSIAQSYATGSVSGGSAVGGLVGAQFSGSIVQSYATGSVSAVVVSSGGLVGIQWGGSIAESYATGMVSGNSGVGGLVGHQVAGSIASSYWDSYTTGQSAGFGTQHGTVTNVSVVTSDPAQSGAANYAFNKGAYANFTFAAGPVTSAGADGWVWAGSGTRPFLAWEVPTAPAGGGPAVIRNAHQLQLINAGDLNGNYVLANDIDLTADLAAVGGKYPGMWSEAGFVPLGTDGNNTALNGSNGFAGNFDGQGHVITRLAIDRPTANDVGLFGRHGGGAISRIGLVGASVRGSDNVGGLVGLEQGKIVHSYVIGDVSGDYYVGGLAGQYTGFGIVQSYAAGNVKGSFSVGGLVGAYGGGDIAQSYATGSVSGDIRIGGLVGMQQGGSITQSYAAGSVSGNSSVGGFVGTQVLGSVTNSYWDMTATGQEHGRAGGDLSGAKGLTTAEMQDLSNFADTYDDWNFTSVWSPPNQVGQNGGSATAYYPELYALSRVVAVAPNGASIVYGTPAQTPIAQYYGLREGDFLTAPATIAGASAAGDADDYPLTASGARASDPAYRFVYQPATLTVTPADLIVTYAATPATSIYGDTPLLTGAVNAAGLKNGDTLVSVTSGTAVWTSAADATVGVGTYGVTGSGLTGNSGNYNVTFMQGAANATALSITPRALTVTANAQSRIYGDANPVLTYAITEGMLVNNDTLTGALTTAATLTDKVGDYAIEQGSLAASDNYDFHYVGAKLTVTPADLIVTYRATPATSIYGETPLLTGTVSALGLKNGDALDSVTSGTAIWSSTGDATSYIGSYAVTGSGLSGNSGNYNVTFAQDAINATALTIDPRALTVTANALSRIYGDANPALTYSVGGLGLVNGDTLTGALATEATLTSNAGDYVIAQGSLKASDNYDVHYVGAKLTVTPADLIVTYAAAPVSSIYGDTPLLTGTVSSEGLKNGDTLDSVTKGTAVWSSTGDATSDIGTYAVTGSGLSGNSSNYDVTFAQDAINAAALTITPRALTVTADALSRIYGEVNPALTYSIGGLGLVNGDTLTGALATDATRASNVDAYAITQGSLAATSNYALTYAGADLTITPADLTVTYRANPVSSIYGDTPSLTGTVSSEGLKNGDTLDSVTKGTAIWSSTGDATSDIGTYAVTGSGLSGNSGNYDVTFLQDAANVAALTITSRALTVTADALSRLFGDANPALTYSIGGRGLVNGDTLTGALATDADRSSIPGPYVIKQGTLTVSTNYSFQFVPGVLTVLDVGPVSSMTIASTQARDAFAAIVNPLTGIDSISSVAGLLPLPDDGLGEQAGSAAGSQVPVAIDCLRKRPCPAEIIAPR